REMSLRTKACAYHLVNQFLIGGGVGVIGNHPHLLIDGLADEFIPHFGKDAVLHLIKRALTLWSALKQLHDVQAKIRFHDAADLVGLLQSKGRIFKRLNRNAFLDPADVATIGRRAVLRMTLGQLSKISALL